MDLLAEEVMICILMLELLIGSHFVRADESGGLKHLPGLEEFVLVMK